MNSSLIPIALTIAGSDAGGGAGIQADLKTFEAHRVFGTSVITAVTAQNTVGVQGIWPVEPEGVIAQLRAVLEDFQLGAIKTGMLFSAEIIEAVASMLEKTAIPLVVDPVMVATSGDHLAAADMQQALEQRLLPLATMVTPNIHEAEALSHHGIRSKPDMIDAAKAMYKRFPGTWILIKGSHLEQDEPEPKVWDLLYHEEDTLWLEGEHIATENTHGSGCTLSAAIAANLAGGMEVQPAVQAAKEYVTGAIRHAWAGTGKGRGSLKHHFRNIS